MPERAVEERHLQLADEHIERGRELMARLRRLIEEARLHEGNVDQATRTLIVMGDVLETFIFHRDGIAQTIADIDAGKL